MSTTDNSSAEVSVKVKQIVWACCDLNASRWLPKPQGYQATPQAQRMFAEQKEKTDKRVFGQTSGSDVFEVLPELLVFLCQNVDGFL